MTGFFSRPDRRGSGFSEIVGLSDGCSGSSREIVSSFVSGGGCSGVGSEVFGSGGGFGSEGFGSSGDSTSNELSEVVVSSSVSELSSDVSSESEDMSTVSEVSWEESELSDISSSFAAFSAFFFSRSTNLGDRRGMNGLSVFCSDISL